MAVGEIFYEKWKSFNYMWRTSLASFIAPDGTMMADAAWYNMGGNSPVWLDTNNLWQVYVDVPHLNVVINKKAELFSRGRWGVRKIKDKKEIEKHEVLELLNSPNPLQSRSEFMTMYSTYKDIWGNLPIFMNNGAPTLRSIPGQLWCLPSNLLIIHRTGKVFKQTDINGIIKYYELDLNGQIERFETQEILLKSDNLGPNYLISDSKILGLKIPLSNIYAAMSTANVLTKEHGAYGILSTAGSKDGSGLLPMSKQEKKRVEQQYDKNYGLQFGKRKMIITGASLTYTPISFPVSEMNLQPEIEQDFGLVCDAYGMARDLFSSTKGATFENQSQALKSTIQNTLQSEGDDLAETFNKAWKMKERGEEIFVSFDHMPAMQEDKKQKEEAEKIRVEKLSVMLKDGIISRETYSTLMGVELSNEPIQGGAEKDSLGKIPLALQQLALARERANTAGDAELSGRLQDAMNQLTNQLVSEVIGGTNE